MDTIILKYQDNQTGVIYTRSFLALRVKGFDPVDDLLDYPDVIHNIVDGSLLHQSIGVRRKFTIELGVIKDDERLFVGNFYQSITKRIIYTHDGILETVWVTRNESVLQTEWKDNTALARYVVLSLHDKYTFTVFPFVNPNPPIYESDMYLKKKVLIAGYVGSPETFTTNVGKLATADAPLGIYPTFNSLIEKYYIAIDGRAYQDCHFHAPTVESVVGGNLVFDIERSDSGNSNVDGGYYADIAIFVVAI